MKRFTILFVMLLFASLSIDAQTFTYNGNWGKSGFNLVNSRTNSVQVIYSVPEFSFEDVLVDGKTMKNVVVPGNFLGNDEGMPNLPGKGSYIAIPQGSAPKLHIVAQRTETLHNVEIAPAQRIPLDTENDFPLAKNPVVYSKNAFYPESPVTMSEVNQIRGVDVIILGVTPFQYNPVTKDLIVYQDLKVEITFEGGSGQYGNDAYRSRWWDPIMQDNILNYSSLPVVDYDQRFQAYTREQRANECEYIIITPEGPDFLAWADTIANFRNQQGILTRIFTLTEVGGNTVAAIEGFIDNAYNTWTIKPAACLLLGDYGTDINKNITSHLYSHPASYPNFASDNKYADVTGDEMPDVIFARIVANNATQLQILCSKFLDNERTPTDDPLFYDKPITALGWQTTRWFQLCSEIVGGFWKHTMDKHPRRINAIYDGAQNVWSTAQNTSQITTYFGVGGREYIPASPTELGGWTGGTATKINNAIDSGAFVLMHRDHGYYDGWGEPAYSSTNINQLNNTKLPFVFSINCQTGSWHRTSDCFGEKFIRHTKNGHNAGALGIVCPTEVSYSFVNDCFVWGMMDNMWPQFMPDKETVVQKRGVLPAFGNAAGKYFLKQSNWPYNSGDKLVTYRLFHMLGDAFTMVYYEVPVMLNVTHDEEIPEGTTTFNITANDSALIALTVDNEIIATGYGHGLYPTVITIPFLPAGTMVLVTVTKQNFYRYSDYVPVTTENIAADFTSNVTDICAGSSVSFTDLSLGDPETWQWTFAGGNPSTSDQQNPQDIVYSEPGNYDVVLTVTKTGQEPSTLTKTAYIHVSAYPESAFENAGNCAGTETTFTDISNPGSGLITSWAWDFGDPASASNTSTEQNPTHLYSAPGTYDVTLITINQGNCPDTVVQSLTIITSPGVAATPTGEGEICQETTGIAYATEGATDATSYVWEVLPSEAGIITGTDLNATLDLATGFTGSATIKVKGVNDCGEGEFSAELPLTVKPLALAPAKPVGTDSVNTNKVASSDFTTEGGANADSYEWLIDPAAAGTISGTGTTGTVTWTQDYKGSASISVKSVNTCGVSEGSEILTVLLYSTLGIGSKGEEIGITLYPNPNDGKFTLTLNARGNHEVNIAIFNSAGIEMYVENGVTVTGKITRSIDLPNLSEGIYYLKVIGESGSAVKKFVIR